MSDDGDDRPRAAFQLNVHIAEAHGLRDADLGPGGGKSDPYCAVEIPGKAGTKSTTRVINNTHDPQWNYRVTIEDYRPGDDLKFTVHDKDTLKSDDLLGEALLPSGKFHPLGFSGELDLENCGEGHKATLMVEVQVVVNAVRGGAAAAAAAGLLGGGVGADDELAHIDDQPTADEGQEYGGAQGNPTEVNDKTFEELQMDPGLVDEVQGTWRDFLAASGNREAAGEAIYAALFDAAPALQSLFKTPRAVMAMRFMNGLNQIINELQNPPAMKVVVETLGFQHLDLEVTVPRVAIFRDAINDLLQMELGAKFTTRAGIGWAIFLNYVGGAYIYIRLTYTARLKILAHSWAVANNRALEDEEGEEQAGAESGGDGGGAESRDKRHAAGFTGEVESAAEKQRASAKAREANGKDKGRKSKGWWGGHAEAAGEKEEEHERTTNTVVPTTYSEMMLFNAAVMGFGQNTWMSEVLASFDTIVTNVSNSYRLQEECDVLSLRLAKFRGTINLSEYKAVMLASLRSLVPKDWNSEHEVAWSWLWENVERMLKAQMGKPAAQERALEALYKNLDEKARQFVRQEVYAKFFALSPAGQDYFKQSTTRLHFIADRIVSMTLEIYKDPKKMVNDISALGLRHVGYGIPTDLFGPFVTACVQVVRSLTDDELAEEGFRWSLSLISRILTRVITEGSTIVMKAINVNSAKQLRKAVACAPRGVRGLWVLNIQVGTQSISPLLWAIESGSLDAAKAILQDLLTIRADRDRYYFGMDTLWERHPDIIKRLCGEAPALLPVLLDGLIWRSRVTEGGRRRVNYYVKHLLVDAEGRFSKTIEWVTANKDPKLICHPVLVMVSEMVWGGVAYHYFLYSKLWFLLTLCLFIFAQSILKTVPHTEWVRDTIFGCRAFIYVFSMSHWVHFHVRGTIKDVRNRAFTRLGGIPVPMYLEDWQHGASLLLTVLLVCMFATEPILYCLDDSSPDHKLFTEECPASKDIKFTYSVFSMFVMLLYYLLLIDMTVFSTRISAFVLVCGRMVSEIFLFCVGLAFAVVSFACAVCALRQGNADFSRVPDAALSLLKITLGMFSGEEYEVLDQDPTLLTAVFVYILVTVVFLINLLIAQLNSSYQHTYQDMLGFARLNRGKIVTEAMKSASRTRWEGFIEALKLEDRVEFGEGDMGLAGGIQVMESASQNPTTVEQIMRFGGSTSQKAQWPEHKVAGEDGEALQDDKLERVERSIDKAIKRLTAKDKKKKGSQGSASGAGSSMAQSSMMPSMMQNGGSVSVSGSESSN